MTFFAELKRRNVFRTGIAYLVVSWLVLQVVDVVSPMLELPGWVPKLILLVLALGLIPTLFFSWVYELTPEGLKKESTINRDQSISHETAKKLDILTISLLVLVAALFAVDRFMPARQQGKTLPEAVSPVTANTDEEISIAVLPFVNMSADPDQEYFSDGISEELLNVLAQFPGLRVAARTSAFQFKGQNRDITEIARQLHVNHVLEGSVRKSGEQLRITAQLIKADSGYHLWSDSWDRQLDDIFAIQDEISAAIAGALQIKLNLIPVMPSIPQTASTEAYEYYLKGRQLINGRSRSGIEQAVILLEKSLELDEQYAPAHAQLAIAITLLKSGGGTYGNYSWDEVMELAVPHVNRAFQLNPNLAEGYGARALLAQLDYDYSKAIEYSQKALELNPSYVDVINWYYLSLLNSGQWHEAVKTIDHMMSVDPLSIIAQINYSYALARYGRFEEARAVADELVFQSSRAGYLSHALISGDYRGEISDSVLWYLRTLQQDPEDAFIRYRLALIFSTVGLFDEARTVAPASAWLIDSLQQRWAEAISQVRKRLEEDPRDNSVKMQAANVLHMSGDVTAAQPLYEELLVLTKGGAIIDATDTSIMPTARAAFGRLVLGDIVGSEEVLELLRQDFQERKKAGIHELFMLSAAAMVSAMENDHEQLLLNLSAAIDTGLRDKSIFREPAMRNFRDNPEFQSVERKMDEILAEEREKTLQLICFDNPAPTVWQPLPESCERVVDIK